MKIVSSSNLGKSQTANPRIHTRILSSIHDLEPALLDGDSAVLDIPIKPLLLGQAGDG